MAKVVLHYLSQPSTAAFAAAATAADDDLLISHQVVSLKDPMSGQRMQVRGGGVGVGAVVWGRVLAALQRRGGGVVGRCSDRSGGVGGLVVHA